MHFCMQNLFYVVVLFKIVNGGNSYNVPRNFNNSDVTDNFVIPLFEHDLAKAKNPFLTWVSNIIGVPALANLDFSTPHTSNSSKPYLRPPKDCRNCKCGIGSTKTRIIGGQETTTQKYPWMVKLLYQDSFYCGGSLISDKYVLTAAHCVKDFNPAKISIKILMPNSSIISKGVRRTVPHERFNLNSFNNDIAVVQLDSPMDYDEHFSPICLPASLKNYAGFEGTVTGWGKQTNGMVSTELQEVMVPILSNTQCRKSAYKPSRITDNMICAGDTDGGKDACQGDSGGPLQIYDDTHYQIVGIISWGEGCAKPNYPGVYTRVNRFLSWIRQNTKNACYCDKT